MDQERAYAKWAFLNAYNLVLLSAGVVLGLATGHHWLVIVTCAAELIWMIYAPGSKFLRRVWFDPAFARAAKLDRDELMAGKIARLPSAEALRVARLVEQKALIDKLARDNPSLAVDLLAHELVKLDAIVEELVELAGAASRTEAHIASFDWNALRRSWHVYDAQAKAHREGDTRREVAEQNLDVLRRRRARYDDLARQLQVIRGQMELIEQTFRLLADEILTMGSPRELGGRIEELRVAVDAVREIEVQVEEVEVEEWIHERAG